MASTAILSEKALNTSEARSIITLLGGMGAVTRNQYGGIEFVVKIKNWQRTGEKGNYSFPGVKKEDNELMEELFLKLRERREICVVFRGYFQ